MRRNSFQEFIFYEDLTGSPVGNGYVSKFQILMKISLKDLSESKMSDMWFWRNETQRCVI